MLRTGYELGTINDERLAQMTSSNKKRSNLLLFPNSVRLSIQTREMRYVLQYKKCIQNVVKSVIEKSYGSPGRRR